MDLNVQGSHLSSDNVMVLMSNWVGWETSTLSVVKISIGSLQHRHIYCTTFMDKSATSISVSYLNMFANMQSCGRFTRGATALAHLFEHFGDACLGHTRQLTEYLTLFQIQFFSLFMFIGELFKYLCIFSGLGRNQLLDSYDDRDLRQCVIWHLDWIVLCMRSEHSWIH